MAVGVMSYAHRSGLSIPGDLSIAGFDDAPSASVVWPQLTTIRQPIFEMAAIAVEMLITGVATAAPLKGRRRRRVSLILAWSFEVDRAAASLEANAFGVEANAAQFVVRGQE